MYGKRINQFNVLDDKYCNYLLVLYLENNCVFRGYIIYFLFRGIDVFVHVYYKIKCINKELVIQHAIA